jgi:hypothetical protein
MDITNLQEEWKKQNPELEPIVLEAKDLEELKSQKN